MCLEIVGRRPGLTIERRGYWPTVKRAEASWPPSLVSHLSELASACFAHRP